jgi:hypothetical protein
VRLASFDSLGKLLDHSEAQSLRAAIEKGTGFVHNGGRGSFYGGFGEGACLDLTLLTDVLQVGIQERVGIFSFQMNKDMSAGEGGDGSEWRQALPFWA